MAGTKELSIGELCRELTGEIKLLFREEMELARTEFSQKATRAGRDAASLAAGVALIFAGLLAALACIIAAVSAVLPVWLSALAVGAFFLIVGALVLLPGISDVVKGRLRPSCTLDSLKKTGDSLRGARVEAPSPEKEIPGTPKEAQKMPSGRKLHEMDEIEAEMESTRQGMCQTISELQQKLSPSHQAEDAGRRIRKTAFWKMVSSRGKAGKTASKAARVMKENPIPVFMAAAGISWLITKGARQKRGGWTFWNN